MIRFKYYPGYRDCAWFRWQGCRKFIAITIAHRMLTLAWYKELS